MTMEVASRRLVGEADLHSEVAEVAVDSEVLCAVAVALALPAEVAALGHRAAVGARGAAALEEDLEAAVGENTEAR